MQKMKKTPFRSTNTTRKWNRSQRGWKNPTTSGECTRVSLCGTKLQTRWRRCLSPSSGWTRTKQVADSHRSIWKSWIRITTNSKVINIVVLRFIARCSLVIRKIPSTYSLQLPAERGYVFDMIWYDMIWYDMVCDTIWYDMIYVMIYDKICYDMLPYDMIWYLITEFCFQPGGSGGKIVHEYKINNCIHGERQYTKQYKSTDTQHGQQNLRSKTKQT